ncbi:MAG: hypothetical protein AAF281_04885 [Pseudomonadota bacterium]
MFERSCRVEAEGVSIRDAEFNDSLYRMVWQTNGTVGPDGNPAGDGQIVFARVDPITGAVDTRHVMAFEGRPVPIGLVRNGPEWAHSARGWEVYYNCYTDDLEQPQICRATQTHEGVTHAVLPGTAGLEMLIPSVNTGDPAPRLLWQRFDGTFSAGATFGDYGWRMDEGSAVDHVLSGLDAVGVWVPDAARLVGPGMTEDGQARPVFLFDTETGGQELLVPNDKTYRGAIAWRAPELDGRLAMMTHVRQPETGGFDLEVYRETATGVWELWTVIDPICPAYGSSDSAEPLVYDGVSYLTLVSLTGNSKATDPGIVWLTHVDPDAPADKAHRRLISNDSCEDPGVNRRDPESLLLANGLGARIYFVRPDL